MTCTAQRCARAIAAGTAHVEPAFLDGALLEEARAACSSSLQALAPPMLRVVAAIESLRVALSAACSRSLLSTAELTLLRYRPGGSYRRHLDDKPGLALGGASRRSLSLLIYLTPTDWAATDGGELRVFPHPGQAKPINFDVLPRAGTLVVFDSATVPHEVLMTHRERVVLTGWLQEATF